MSGESSFESFELKSKSSFCLLITHCVHPLGMHFRLKCQELPIDFLPWLSTRSQKLFLTNDYTLFALLHTIFLSRIASSVDLGITILFIFSH